MRSTTERMLLLKKRTDELKKRRKAKKHMLAVISYCSLCLVLIAVVSALVCDLNFNGFEHMSLPDAAGVFADKAFAGYAAVGILAFLLGISVTLMCDILHKRRKERDKENDRADR